MDWHLGSSGTSLPDGDLGAAAPSGPIALFGNPSGGQPAPFPPLDNLIGGKHRHRRVQHQPTEPRGARHGGAVLRPSLELLSRGGRLDLASRDQLYLLPWVPDPFPGHEYGQPPVPYRGHCQAPEGPKRGNKLS